MALGRYYCISGVSVACPAGRWASATGQASSACEGACVAGRWGNAQQTTDQGVRGIVPGVGMPRMRCAITHPPCHCQRPRLHLHVCAALMLLPRCMYTFAPLTVAAHARLSHVGALCAASTERAMRRRVRVCHWVGQCDGVAVWRCVGVLPSVVWVRYIGTGWVLLHWCIDEHPDSGGRV